MRVFLDTNVLAAAFGTRGLCGDVLREVLLRHELLTCAEVEEELFRALTVKFGVPREVARGAVALVRGASVRAPSSPLRSLPLRDVHDVAVVSAAVNGRAALLVTGDRELQALGRVGSLEVVSPRRFWERGRRRPANTGE